MDGATITLTVEIRCSAEFLSGRARVGDGPWRDFSGRLGLMGVVDALASAADVGSRGAPLETKEHA